MNPHIAIPSLIVIACFAVQLFAADAPPATHPASPLDFKVKDIDGKEVNLADYKGKVVMLVNVASKCGNTPQYGA